MSSYRRATLSIFLISTRTYFLEDGEYSERGNERCKVGKTNSLVRNVRRGDGIRLHRESIPQMN